MGVEILRVEDGQTLKEFVDLPYRLYRDDPFWVPPLRVAQKELLNSRKHPFYAHAQMQCFLALRDGIAAGRVAAVIDRNFNAFHGEQAGFFGFFESVVDPEVSRPLLEAAREWLRQRGSTVIRGPVNPSTNYECGLLVSGFDSRPSVMMPYNPPQYGPLLESLGLRKSKDLLAYTCRTSGLDGSKVERVAAHALEASGVQVRPIRMKAFAEEVERVWKVYNSAWESNWGFVPMTREEFLHSAAEMKQILVPDLVLIGERGERMAGFALALPNVNEALLHARGRLFPLGLFKILYHQRKIRNLRVVALGVIQEFRTSGVAAAFYATLIRNASRLGYEHAEMSWILEDNVLMNRSLQTMGARLYKTYRLYEWN